MAPLSRPPHRNLAPGLWARWSSLRLVLFGFALLAGNFLVQILIYGTTGLLFLPVLAGNLLGVILPCVLASRLNEGTFARDFHLRWPGAGGATLAVVAALVALSPTSFLAHLSSRIHAVDPDWIAFYREMLPDTVGGLALATATVVLVAPLAEELLFRGLLYRLARRSWGPWPAAVVSALAFGLVHGEPWYLFGLVGLGMWLAFLYESTGSLLMPVVAHATHNGISLLLMVKDRATLGAEEPITAVDGILLAASLAVGLLLAVLLLRRRRSR